MSSHVQFNLIQNNPFQNSSIQFKQWILIPPISTSSFVIRQLRSPRWMAIPVLWNSKGKWNFFNCETMMKLVEIGIFETFHPHTPTHTPTYTHIHPHTPTHTYIHPHTPAYTSIHPHTPTYTHIHLHTPTYTYIHPHTPTRTRMQPNANRTMNYCQSCIFSFT